MAETVGVLASELRYTAGLFWLIVVFALTAVVSGLLAASVRPTVVVMTAIFVLVGAAAAFSTLLLGAWWFRTRPKPVQPVTGPSARYVPLIVGIGTIALCAYVALLEFLKLYDAHWQGDIRPLVYRAVVCLFFGFIIVRNLRDRFGAPRPLPPSAQRVLEAYALAKTAPTLEERKRILRPIMMRGWIRLALFASGLPLFFLLAPYIGYMMATLASIAIVSGIFLGLHYSRFRL